MKMNLQFFLLFIMVISVFLNGCATTGFSEAKRDDIRIQKMSDARGNIGSVRVYDKADGTAIRGSVHRKTRFTYLSGHIHFDLYDNAGARLESSKTTYRVRSKNKSMYKTGRFSGRLESKAPQQARLVVTHHGHHDKEETLQERLNAQSDGRLRIE